MTRAIFGKEGKAVAKNENSGDRLINSDPRMTAPEISQGEAIETICAELLAWVDALPVKHPQQAALRERARAALATPRTPAATGEGEVEAVYRATNPDWLVLTGTLRQVRWNIAAIAVRAAAKHRATAPSVGEGELRAALAALPPASMGEVYDTVYQAIRNFELDNMRDEGAGTYPLVDAMTCDGAGIDDGEEQMRRLTDDIVAALPLPPPSSRKG